MREEDMNCKEIYELLTAYLDDEVTKDEKALVESHLPDCPQCQAELEALKVTQVNLKSVLTSMADEVVPSTEAWKNVRAKIEKKNGWLEGFIKILTSQKWQAAAVTAAVVVVAVSAATWQISGAGQEPLISTRVPFFDGPSPASTAPAAETATPTTPKASTTPTTPAPAPTAPTAPTTPTPPGMAGAPPPVITVTPPNVTVQAPAPAQVTVNTTPQSQQPVEVVSVSVPPQSINPGGPVIEISLKNVSSEPVVSLTAGIELAEPGKIFNFDFDVTSSNPLLPDKTVSARKILIGGGYSDKVYYPLTINGTLQSGETFAYTRQALIGAPEPASTPTPPPTMTTPTIQTPGNTVQAGAPSPSPAITDIGVTSRPPLRYVIVTDVFWFALYSGLLMMLGLAFRNRFARAAAGAGSILFGFVGLYVALYALLWDKSDLFLANGIFPIFGLIMGTAAIKSRAGYLWTAITGMVLCFTAVVLDVIFVINFPITTSYPSTVWSLALTILISAVIIVYAFRFRTRQI